jgi:hypothetical protein
VSEVFFRGSDRDDLIAVASLAIAHYQNNAFQSQQIFRSIGPGTFTFFPGSTTRPDLYAYESDDALRVSIKGTDNALQWCGHILQSNAFPFGQFSGQVISFFGTVAQDIVDMTREMFAGVIGHKKIAIVGHSFGAALAQLLGNYWWNAKAVNPSVVCLGCPRVGTDAFADSMKTFVVRVENENDLICGVPPEIWQGIGAGIPPLGPGVPVHLAHAGEGHALQPDGTLTGGSDPLNAAQVAYYLARGYIEPHDATSYLAALQAGLKPNPLAPGDDEYQAPALLAAATFDQLGLGQPLNKQGPGETDMAATLVQGLMFFKHKTVPQGWSESIYAATSVPSMTTLLQTLVPERAKGLAADCEIVGYRSSSVNPPKDSFTDELNPPTVGVITGACNEPGDCYLYQFRAQSHRRRMTYRGISDADIQGGVANALPNPTSTALDAFNGLLQTNACVIKIIDPANSWFPITSMANAPGSGEIQITTGGFHGLVNGDIINLRGIRNYPYLLGRWKVGVVNTETFTLKGSDRYTVNLSNEGEIIQVEYAGATPSGWNFRGVGYHETGRPTFLPRGRASVKILHH